MSRKCGGLVVQFLLFLAVSAMASSSSEATKYIQQVMEADGIVPDTIDEAPSAKLTVVYNGKELEFGQELTPTEVKDEPKVQWEADPEKFYLLLMFDPDAPSRISPTFSNVNHWLIGNIKGCDISTGDVITEYLGSGPPKGTELHRYIFLVFEQTGKLDFDEPRTSKTSRAHRLKFSVRDFNRKYKLGKPWAGNFFKAQWDPYVDERNKNITND